MLSQLDKKDTRTQLEKRIDKFNRGTEITKDSNNFNNASKDPKLKNVGKDPNSILRQAGLSDSFAGIRASNNYTNKKIIGESSMQNLQNIRKLQNSNTIPIKKIILEFTADHFREHAGKYSVGTMLGAGAGLGYLAANPDALDGDSVGNDHNGQPTKVSGSNDTRSDFQKDLAKNVSSTNTFQHNQNKGLFGNLAQGLGTGLDNVKAENKFNNMTDAQREYEDLKNSDGDILTTGQKIMGVALGAGALGAAALKGISRGKASNFGRR